MTPPAMPRYSFSLGLRALIHLRQGVRSAVWGSAVPGCVRQRQRRHRPQAQAPPRCRPTPLLAPARDRGQAGGAAWLAIEPASFGRPEALRAHLLTASTGSCLLLPPILSSCLSRPP